MKALVFRGPKELSIEEVPEPRPQPGEVVLRPTLVGICGSDLHAYAGETGRRVPGQIMGHEVAAVVVEADGSGIQTGTRVTFNPVVGCSECGYCRVGRTGLCPARRVIGVTKDAAGAFSELVAVPGSNLRVLPEAVPDQLGALIEPLAVGVHAASLAGRLEGAQVGIIGSGTIGLTSAIAARALGAGRVIICDLLPERLTIAEALGFETRRELVAGEFDLGADAVIDAVGITQTLESGLTTLRPGGTLVMVGLGRPEVGMKLFDLVAQERRLLGSYCYDVQDFDRAVAMAADPAVGLEKLAGRVLPLAEGQQAFLDLAEGRDSSVKVMLQPPSVQVA